ncbi:MAG: transglycosylase SLT domain-containing protein, partial [Candidatus Omnitrophica bacterium]|nr:transglycosylase SLT domain-containing protein [Candidatus Omnitrophota bacterium]
MKEDISLAINETFRENEAFLRKYFTGVDDFARFIKAIIRRESNFNPTAVSHAGAAGLMQVMPATFEEITRQLGEDWTYGDVFDVYTNV